MNIFLDHISKQFGDKTLIKRLSLAIKDGEMLSLLGPSGSGKTTLLRMIAGLESCENGKIFFDEKEVTKLHVRKRRIGFVFQHYALFPHLTLFENVAFGLRVLPKKLRPSTSEIKKTVDGLLEMVQLLDKKEHFSNQLSGGQKQRIALARAMAIQPDVLLLDEPFGALDALVRKDLRKWLKELHQELKFTSIFVTHDQEEALGLSDRVAILNDGAIQQIDTPRRLTANPANEFVYDFLGQGI